MLHSKPKITALWLLCSLMLMQCKMRSSSLSDEQTENVTLSEYASSLPYACDFITDWAGKLVTDQNMSAVELDRKLVQYEQDLKLGKTTLETVYLDYEHVFWSTSPIRLVYQEGMKAEFETAQERLALFFSEHKSAGDRGFLNRIAEKLSRKLSAITVTQISAHAWVEGLGIWGEFIRAGNDKCNRSFLSVAVGESHSCAILGSEASVVCAGFSSMGQLGRGEELSSQKNGVLKHALGWKNVKQLAAGDFHTCAILGEKSGVECVGYNGDGQLGRDDGWSARNGSPKPVLGWKNVKQLVAGSDHTCAILEDEARVECSGDNTYGQLGQGEDYKGRNGTPKAVIEWKKVKQIVAGREHTCAVLGDEARVECVGSNYVGQLGRERDRTAKNGTPKPVPGWEKVKQLVAGNLHTCAILGDEARVECVGTDFNGQLGRAEEYAERNSIPKLVPGWKNIKQLAAGRSHTCAILGAEAHVECVGSNSMGQLGRVEGYLERNGIPKPVLGWKNVTQIAARADVTCAIFGNKVPVEVECVGNNKYGQLGRGEVYQEKNGISAPMVLERNLISNTITYISSESVPKVSKTSPISSTRSESFYWESSNGEDGDFTEEALVKNGFHGHKNQSSTEFKDLSLIILSTERDAVRSYISTLVLVNKNSPHVIVRKKDGSGFDFVTVNLIAIVEGKVQIKIDDQTITKKFSELNSNYVAFYFPGKVAAGPKQFSSASVQLTESVAVDADLKSSLEKFHKLVKTSTGHFSLMVPRSNLGPSPDTRLRICQEPTILTDGWVIPAGTSSRFTWPKPAPLANTRKLTFTVGVADLGPACHFGLMDISIYGATDSGEKKLLQKARVGLKQKSIRLIVDPSVHQGLEVEIERVPTLAFWPKNYSPSADEKWLGQLLIVSLAQ